MISFLSMCDEARGSSIRIFCCDDPTEVIARPDYGRGEG
jgi:hypothetical protein